MPCFAVEMANEKAKIVHLRDEQNSQRISVETQSLPPISALRAFEAAARHQRLTGAANELNVTPSAISHQLRVLEDWLGIRLFQRNVRPLALTTEGTLYSRALGRAFDTIFEATRDILHNRVRTPLTISTMGSFATNWLVPRLGELQSACADLDIRISVSDQFVDFEREGIDAAIRYGHGRWKNSKSELLFDDNVIAVCSPVLLSDPDTIGTSAAPVTLLHDAAHPGWEEWIAKADTNSLSVAKSISFTHTHLALQAALGGMGIALASEILVRDMIECGNLVQFGTTCLQGSGAYYFVVPFERSQDTKIQTFSDWLRRQLMPKV